MGRLSLLYFVAFSIITSVFSVSVHRIDLPIVNENIAPDGFERPTVLANGTFPGPLLSGNMGDQFQINVINGLTDSDGMDVQTTIHWHGIYQHHTPEYDGVAWVTQCPIVPGHAFLYNFTVPQQAGTFWYHSHYANQYCDGLRGPLVIYDPNDPYACLYDVDDVTTIITLADWYHYLSHDEGLVPSPNTTLINGHGRYAGGPNSSLAVIDVEQGKRYRFRLLGLSCDTSFVFSIDGHQMTVIEADGNNVDPVLVDSITVYAAQRYSFILNASQNVDNYWVRAEPDNINASFVDGMNSAILRYKGADLEYPDTNQTISLLTLNETDLHARENPQAPGEPYPGGVDRQLELDVVFNIVSANQSGLFYVNGTPWMNPEMPVLLQILSGAKSAQELLPSGSVYGINLNDTVEIVLPGVENAGTNHPVHLHGHSFSVVKSSDSDIYNYENPVRRDVVKLAPIKENITVIRFQADNPGPWFLHCHIDWHLTAGFAAVMAEDVPDIPTVDPPTAAWDDLCPIWNATYGGTSPNPIKAVIPANGTTSASTSSVTLLPSTVSVSSGTPTLTATGTVTESDSPTPTVFTSVTASPVSLSNSPTSTSAIVTSSTA